MEYSKKDTLANRLHFIMKERGLKQVDVLHLAEPFCKMYNVSLGKSSISLYCNGKNEPGRKALNVLSLALQVNPEWLQGFDVPMELPSDKRNDNKNNVKKEVKTMNKITKSSKLDNVLYDVRGPVLDEATRMGKLVQKYLN